MPEVVTSAASAVSLLLGHARCPSTCPASSRDESPDSPACGYRVAWSINPHMRVGTGDASRATVQLEAFADVLVSLGANVHRVPYVHGAHDSVFVKDVAVVVQRADGTRGALLGRFRHRERARESFARRNHLRALGIEDVRMARAPLEGGDVVVSPDATKAVLGTGFRSAPEAAPELAAFLDAEVTPVRLVDPRLYHLDMVLSFLSDGTALVCEDAIADVDLRKLEALGLLDTRVVVPIDEALAFSANVVEVGRAVVLGSSGTRTAAALRDRGFVVVGCDLREFHLAGGSAACLVSRVHTKRSEVEELPPCSTAA